MIRNIVFDMGNVIITFDRQHFLDCLDIDIEDKKMLMKEVFISLEWANMDRGTMNESDAYESIIKRLPEYLHPYAHKLVFEWNEMSAQIEGIYDLIRRLKEKGYGIYLLSNASRRLNEYWKEIEVNKCFDGMIVSADCGYVKPEHEIYELLLDRYGLKAEECFFVDDMALNAEGARHAGMASMVFHGDAKEIEDKLRELGVDV